MLRFIFFINQRTITDISPFLFVWHNCKIYEPPSSHAIIKQIPFRDLNNPPICASSPLPAATNHHYLLSPHLLRRKIYQQQQQQNNSHHPSESHYLNGYSSTTGSPTNKVRLLRSVSAAPGSNINSNSNNSNCNLYSHHQVSPQQSPSLSSRHAFAQ